VKFGTTDDPKEKAKLDFKLDVLRVQRDRWASGYTAAPALVAVAGALAADNDKDDRENAQASIERQLRRHAAKGEVPGILAELMVCDRRGLPLSNPYTFKTWPEVEPIARRLGMDLDDMDGQEIKY
jgi:hypothetical protein